MNDEITIYSLMECTYTSLYMHMQHLLNCSCLPCASVLVNEISPMCFCIDKQHRGPYSPSQNQIKGNQIKNVIKFLLD